MWLKAILPKKGYVPLQQQILKLFSVEGQWAAMVHNQAYVSPQGDTLWASVKLRYNPGAQKPKDIPLEGLAKWLGQWVGITRDYAAWVEGYAAHALSGDAYSNGSLLSSQHL